MSKNHNKLNSDDFSFHTLEFKIRIDKKLFKEKVDEFFEQAHSEHFKIYREDNIIKILKYKKNGILIDMKQTEQGSFVNIRINPRKLNGDVCYYGVFKADKENIENIRKALYICMQEFRLTSDEAFLLNRIDLCYNLEVSFQEVADEYVNLLSRARIPYPFKIIDRRNEQYKNGRYFKAKDFEIYVYNKQRQLVEVHGENEAFNRYIVRFEIRPRRKKIKRLYDKYNYDSVIEFLKNIKDISFEEFKKYIPLVFLEGEYRRYSDLVDTINKSRYHTITKERMIVLAEICTKTLNLQKAIDTCKHQYNLSDRKINELLYKFNELNINPICIPSRVLKDTASLPSIPYLMGLPKDE